jgi:hypothetical protein
VEQCLGPYLEWCLATLLEPASNPNPHLKLGILTSLANIFKLGKRQELLSKAGTLWPTMPINTYCLCLGLVLSALANEGDTSITWRKLKIKLAQRVGLVLLKPLSQNWRYQKSMYHLIIFCTANGLMHFLKSNKNTASGRFNKHIDCEWRWRRYWDSCWNWGGHWYHDLFI